MGSPPPKHFPKVLMSGLISKYFCSVLASVLRPVIISSKINSILYFFEITLKNFKYSFASSVGNDP